jgi:osmotically-inducible protein OsmY
MGLFNDVLAVGLVGVVLVAVPVAGAAAGQNASPSAVAKADHVVTLRGTVASSAAKVRVGEIARSTDGVTRVVNELVVKGT